MGEIEIIEETPLALSEVKKMLGKIEKRDKELTARAVKVKEYLDKFAKLDSKKIEEIRKKLEGLEISRLRPRHVNKIIDVMPKDISGLRAIFAGENITLKLEDLKRILECLK